MVRLHHICLHHTHYTTCPHSTLHQPCTILVLHHLDLVLHHALHHSRPAPHCTTLACTIFALHHTLDLVLHHALLHSRPAPHCTTLHHTAPHSPAPHPPAPHWTTRMHHICPAPHLPCTTLACTIFALLSQDSQLKGTTRNNNENRHF